MTVGITGGMGCGKSTVTAMFVAAGYAPIDSDRLIHELILPDEEVRNLVRQRLGAAVFAADGQIDRKKLGQRVFASDEDRLWLEQVTHPRLFEVWRSRIQAEPGRSWVFEVPLLFEKHLEIWFDFTLCVASSPGQQLARLEQRGIPRPLAEQRISKQLPLEQKIQLADIVLWNDGSIGFLQDQVNILIRKLDQPSLAST